ncbi:MAG: class I SAM-dependent methyltransferase [Pseudomonadota bacterium]
MRDRWLSPPALMGWLARQARRRGLCLECGAGRGEIGHFMAGCFDQVLLLDQRSKVWRPDDPKVWRLRGQAEAIPLTSGSVDLLVSMQALHHFRLEDHLQEAARVLRSGGVFAALSWGALRLPQAIARAYAPTFRSLDAFWEDQRPWVLSGYAGTAFPGRAITLPRAALRKRLRLADLELEIARWSAMQTALKLGAEIADPDSTLPAFNSTERFEAIWPIVGLVYSRS